MMRHAIGALLAAVAAITLVAMSGERFVATAESAPTTTTTTFTSTTALPTTTTTTTAPPPTTTTAPPAPPTTPAEVGAAALARIDYPWQHLGWSITFEAGHAGLLGKANCQTKQVTVHVRPSQSVTQVAFVTAFEIGHAVDCDTMTDERRAEWAAIRGFAPGWRWFPSCLCTEDDFGSGDISMVFADWLVPDGGYGWRSNLAGRPGPDELARLLPYLTAAAR